MCAEKTANKKFEEIIETAPEDIADWILREDVKNWTQLEEKLDEMDLESKNLDELVKICASARLNGEDAEDG